MLLTACVAGADDSQVLSLAVAQAHYAVSSLAVHEVGEWFTYHGTQVFPPHRPDPYLPHDQDGGPDGNGQVVLWLDYGPAAGEAPEAKTPLDAAADQYVDLAAIGTLPGQAVCLSKDGVTVDGPGCSSITLPWSGLSPVPAATNSQERVLHLLHQAVVASELRLIAQNLRVQGESVLAPVPGPYQDQARVNWRAHLTYDG
ncbi:hypothetical protein ABZ502_17515 [Streptomyces abikoensis]|uniref:hypothetical protein n=1 Tax=Streptomyces abikoensis TaxID=97398 RepID=UPI0033E9F38A